MLQVNLAKPEVEESSPLLPPGTAFFLSVIGPVSSVRLLALRNAAEKACSVSIAISKE